MGDPSVFTCCSTCSGASKPKSSRRCSGTRTKPTAQLHFGSIPPPFHAPGALPLRGTQGLFVHKGTGQGVVAGSCEFRIHAPIWRTNQPNVRKLAVALVPLPVILDTHSRVLQHYMYMESRLSTNLVMSKFGFKVPHDPIPIVRAFVLVPLFGGSKNHLWARIHLNQPQYIDRECCLPTKPRLIYQDQPS